MKWYTSSLRAAVEELAQGFLPRVGVEAVVLLDSHPRQLAPLPCEFVAEPGVLLLENEKPLTRCRRSISVPLVSRNCGRSSQYEQLPGRGSKATVISMPTEQRQAKR